MSLLEKIKGQPLPEGYDREGIILPPMFYAVTEKKVMVLGKEVVKTELEKAKDLPEGFIFSENYTPRIYIEGGKVTAIEILKKKG
ncbi:MAG: hypothetical protein LUQ65_07005 [Candidatus Helarchaeota archaeon]|nr:hypothetical protein [Candidatus Helarchaeota archaeon]